jgi:hypothetical protein
MTNAVSNPNLRPGRPLGSRNRLSNKLITDLSEIWFEQGPGILKKMAMREPGQLARLAYATLPKDILVSVEQRIPGGLSPGDWQLLQSVLDLIRSAIPAGSNAPPAEVLGVVENALRAHFARQLPPSTGAYGRPEAEAQPEEVEAPRALS